MFLVGCYYGVKWKIVVWGKVNIFPLCPIQNKVKTLNRIFRIISTWCEIINEKQINNRGLKNPWPQQLGMCEWDIEIKRCFFKESTSGNNVISTCEIGEKR